MTSPERLLPSWPASAIAARTPRASSKPVRGRDRPEPALDHRPRARRPADHQRGRHDRRRPQRRDLQLPRSCGSSSSAHGHTTRDRRRHRGDRPPRRGSRRVRAGAQAGRHVRVRGLGSPSASGCCSGATASARSRCTTGRSADTFVFASEIKGVLAHPAVPCELDDAALPAYLTFGYVPTPHTFFAGIQSLPPATC